MITNQALYHLSYPGLLSFPLQEILQETRKTLGFYRGVHRITKAIGGSSCGTPRRKHRLLVGYKAQ